MQIFLFLKLSIVRHFPKAAVQTKKATLEGIFCFQMLFQGKKLLTMADKKMVVCTNREPLTLTRQPTSLILLNSPYRSAINGIDEAPKSFQFTPSCQLLCYTNILSPFPTLCFRKCLAMLLCWRIFCHPDEQAAGINLPTEIFLSVISFCPCYPNWIRTFKQIPNKS